MVSLHGGKHVGMRCLGWTVVGVGGGLRLRGEIVVLRTIFRVITLGDDRNVVCKEEYVL